MKAYAIAYVTACFVALGLTPLVIRLARAGGLVDRPNARKVHRVPTPRVGGIAIAVATAAAFLLVGLFTAGDLDLGIDRGKALRLFAAAMCVFAVGLIDDVRNLPAKLKLFAVVAAAVAVCYSGMRIERISLGNWIDIPLGFWSWPLSVLWIVGMTVAMNFIDGLDGLAAGIAAIACGVVAVIGSAHGSTSTTMLALSLMGALTGFLVFNYNPARIFMGDSGSMLLGFMIGATSIAAAPANKTVLGLGLPALAMSVPLLDSLVTIVRRGVVHRRSIFAAECGHVHHRLLHIGLSHRNAVILLHALTLLGGGVAVLLVYIHHPAAAVLLACVPPVIVTAFFLLTGSMQLRTSVAAFRRNLNLGREVKRHRNLADDLQLRIRRAGTIEDWWREFCAAADCLGATHLRVRMPGQGRELLSWRAASSERQAPMAVSIDLPLPGAERSAEQHLEVSLAGDSLHGIALRIDVLARLLDNQEVGRLVAEAAAAPETPAEAVAVARATHPGRPAGRGTMAGALLGDHLYSETLAATPEP